MRFRSEITGVEALAGYHLHSKSLSRNDFSCKTTGGDPFLNIRVAVARSGMSIALISGCMSRASCAPDGNAFAGGGALDRAAELGTVRAFQSGVPIMSPPE
jgi:hypothetical protein